MMVTLLSLLALSNNLETGGHLERRGAPAAASLSFSEEGASQPPPPSRRRVNWFQYPVAIGHEYWNTSSRTLDGLNNIAWARRHRGAITGYMPCCGCWNIEHDGSFTSSGMCLGLKSECTNWNAGVATPCDPRLTAQRDAEIRAELAMGLEIIPTGLFHQTNATQYLLDEFWTRPGSMASAVALVRENGWAGLSLDNEEDAKADPRLPGLVASFVGNLSAALHSAGFRLVVDITSTWHGNLGGPEFVPLYARRAAPSTVFFDMATYFNSRPNGMSMGETLAKLSAMVGGAGRAAAGVGAEMSPGCVVTSCRATHPLSVCL